MEVTTTIRPVEWSRDELEVASIDSEWTADRILQVGAGHSSFTLTERALDAPYQKDRLPPASRVESLKSARECFVAETQGEIVGVVGLYLSEWNFRPSVGNLRVSAGHRRAGVGRALVRQVIAAAGSLRANGLWLEVTNVNIPAINLYRSVGFRLCGLDQAMYMRWGLDRETALFFLYEY